MTTSVTPGLAIIGSGYTAASVLTHLLDADPQKAEEISVFGPAPFGHGAAFGTEHRDFRLNVRAQIMQLRPARPDDFPLWADHALDDPEAHRAQGSFYRRADFARYLDERLSQLPGFEAVRFDRRKVTSVRYDKGSALWHIAVNNDETFSAKTLILATGNPEPDWPCLIDKACLTAAREQLVRSPWSGAWVADCAPDRDILVIGGGLTAMDAIYALGRAGHLGKIRVVTPVGILPPAQTRWVADEAVRWPDDITSATGFIQFFNRNLKQNQPCPWTDPVWQTRFEALRVNMNPVWRALAGSEKRRLMAHLGAFWSLARYRSAPQTSAMAATMKASGQLEIHTGRVIRIAAGNMPHRLSVHLTTGDVAEVDYVVNCTGMGRDSLLADLIANKVIQPDAFGRGPGLGDHLALCLPDGQAYPAAFAVGAMTAGSEGDVVGATTISRQAAALARHIRDV